MPSPSEPDAGAGARVLAELAALRASVERLTAENAALRERLELCEHARVDLFAQSRHVLELLAESRREVWHLQARAPHGS